MGSAVEAWSQTVREMYLPDWLAEYTWSDNYRGIDFEIVEDAPSDVVQEQLMEARGKAALWKRRVEALEDVLRDSEGVGGD